MDEILLGQKLESIEARLDKLEALLESKPKIELPPVAVKVRTAQAAVVKQETAKNSIHWLGAVSVVCFVIAAAFIIKLAIESGWLTPIRQIGLACVLAAALIQVGFRLLKTDREYASLLPAAGIIIFYLSAFAASKYYQLLSPEIGLGIVSLVSCLCLWLYTQIKTDLYPIVAAIGAYLAPTIVGLMRTGASEFSLFYFVLCSVCFSMLSVWLETRTLLLISAYLAIGITSILGLPFAPKLPAILLLVQFLVFTFSTYLYTVEWKKPLSVKEAWSFLPALLFFYSTEYYYLNKINPALAPWISLGFAILLLVIYQITKKSQQALSSGPMLASFSALVFFHSFYLVILPEEIRPWLFVVIMLLLAFVSKKREMPTPLKVILGLVLFVEYMQMMNHLLNKSTELWYLVSTASFISLLIYFVLNRSKMAKNTDQLILFAAHGLAILSLYRLAEPFSSLAVSGSWLAYALAIMGYGILQRDEVLTKSALFALAAASAKALLFDASSAATILRIVCLLLTGVVLYGCGFLLRRMTTWHSQKEEKR